MAVMRCIHRCRMFCHRRKWSFWVVTIVTQMTLAALLLNGSPLRVTSRSTRKPNIIFVLADDLGWNDIGYHGSDVRTPVLDSLAASGVKLDNYYVQPICSPSRGQFMLGRYQIHTGLQSNNLPSLCPCGLPLQFPTIADMMRKSGYATHIVGKWHLGFYTKDHMPTRRGFDSYFGFLLAQQGYFDHVFIKTCLKERESCHVDFHHNMKPVTDKGGQYSTHLFRDRTIQVIREHAKNTPDKPLFIYLPFQAVHGPLEAPQEYYDQLPHIPDAERRTFAAMALAMDSAVGDVIQTLKEHNMWEDTLIAFSSDNGGQMRSHGNNWPLRGGKNTLWEGGIRVAGFVSGPVLPRAGVTSRHLMHVTDWFPTLVGLAGGDVSDMNLDGYDMWDTISKGAPSPRREILHNINHLHETKGGRLSASPFDNRLRAAIRVDEWKLITGDAGPSEWVLPHAMRTFLNGTPVAEDPVKNMWLFNVEEDPDERYDLSEERPLVVKRLLHRLAHYDSTAVAPIPESKNKSGLPKNPGDVWGPWM